MTDATNNLYFTSSCTQRIDLSAGALARLKSGLALDGDIEGVEGKGAGHRFSQLITGFG